MSDARRAIATGVGTTMVVVALGALVVSMRGTHRRRAFGMMAWILITGLVVVLALG